MSQSNNTFVLKQRLQPNVHEGEDRLATRTGPSLSTRISTTTNDQKEDVVNDATIAPATSTKNPKEEDDSSSSSVTSKNTLGTFSRRLIAFAGPGFLVAVGYIDPGNYSTDLFGGSQFGYPLLFVVLFSNLIAILLQYLAALLGIITNKDLAQVCRLHFHWILTGFLWITAELGIVACDVAEVIGSAVALNLLFNCPLWAGILITGADVLIILFGYNNDGSIKSIKHFERFIGLLVLGVSICLTMLLIDSKPVIADVFMGFVPSSELVTNQGILYAAMGIIGATVMPHNIFLGSHLVKARRVLGDSESSMSVLHLKSPEEFTRISLIYSAIDIVLSLTFAFYVNAALLIIAAASFYYVANPIPGGVADLFIAYNLLETNIGQAAGLLYALSLLFSGQSSTITATMAGQVIMEGFTGWRSHPVIRRLVTRSMAIVPALIVVVVAGKEGLANLLVLSQVILSVQLTFVMVPLVYFCGMGSLMISNGHPASSVDGIVSPEMEPHHLEMEELCTVSTTTTANTTATPPLHPSTSNIPSAALPALSLLQLEESIPPTTTNSSNTFPPSHVDVLEGTTAAAADMKLPSDTSTLPSSLSTYLTIPTRWWKSWRAVPEGTLSQHMWKTSPLLNIVSILVCLCLTGLNFYMLFTSL